MRLLLAAAATLALAACTQSQADVADDVAGYGFTDVQVQGHAWAECAESDTFATRFTATNPAGQHVSGTLCKGTFKGSTIRNVRLLPN